MSKNKKEIFSMNKFQQLRVNQPIIFGMRTEGGEEDDFDNILDTDEDFGDSDFASRLLPHSGVHKHLTFNRLSRVTSFFDISSYITSLAAAMIDYQLPEQFVGEIDLIPEKKAPPDLIQNINTFFNTRDSSNLNHYLEDFDYSQISEMQTQQLQIIQHIYDKSILLDFIASKDSDSRISALVQFLQSFNQTPEVELAHLINCAVDYVKLPSILPISAFFEDFRLPHIFTRICDLLVILFRKNPLVPSAIHKLAPFTDHPEITENLIPSDDNIDEDDDMSSDFSSDFLEDLKQTRNVVPLLELENTNNVTNFLDLTLASNQVGVAFFPEAPVTATYLLKNGDSKMTPPDFQSWFIKDDKRPIQVSTDDGNISQSDEETTSSLPNSIPQMKLDKFADYSIMYSKMVRHSKDVTIPTTGEFALTLPIIHYQNCTNPQAVVSGTDKPRFYLLEHSANRCFERRDQQQFENIIEKYLEYIPDKLPLATLAPLENKRELPCISIEPDHEIFSLMSLIDISLLLEDRSPLSFLQYPCFFTKPSFKHPALDKEWRTQALYHIYITTKLPPYLIFRAGFALAVSFMEKNTQLATSVLFEALYSLLEAFPIMRSTNWCQAAFFLFGELLELTGKYYYCALAHDIAHPMTICSRRMCSKAAQIAQRNKDTIRAVFYFIKVLILYLHAPQFDEALYTAQILAGIFKDNNQYIEGIEMLNHILNDTHQIGVKFRHHSKLEYYGSLKYQQTCVHPATQTTKSIELTKPENVNTVLTAATLAQFFLKMNQFTSACEILDHLEKRTVNDSVSKVTSYLRSKVLFSVGETKKFIQSIPYADLKSSRNSFKSVKLGILSFDTTFALLKLLTKFYIVHNLGRNALFVSEHICANALCSNKITNELAEGLYLRGLSIFTILMTSYGEEIELRADLSEELQSLGTYKDIRKYDRIVLISEGMSSLIYARNCFERNGNIYKQVEATLLYVEYLIIHFYGKQLFEKTQADPVTITKPDFITVVKNEINIDYEDRTIDAETFPDELNAVCSNLERTTGTLMDPHFIIRSQLVMSVLNFLKQKTTPAKTYFDFAVMNLKKFFFIGKKYALRPEPEFITQQFFRSLQLLCMHLLSFDKDFIQKNIIVFFYNDQLSYLMKNQRRTKVREPFIRMHKKGLVINQSIYDLINSCYPDFTKVLGELKMQQKFHKGRESLSTHWEILMLYRKIRSTCKNFSQGKLNEKKLIEMNQSYCRRIELIITQKSSPEHHEVSQKTVFIAHILKWITTINLENGLTKVTRIHSKIDSTFKFKGWDFYNHSRLFNSKFLRAVFNLMISDPHEQSGAEDMTMLKVQSVDLRRTLFNELTDFPELPYYEDDKVLEGRFSGAKGKLNSLLLTKQTLYVVADNDTQFLPFEFMFPERNVIRSYNNGEKITKMPSQCKIYRFKIDKDKSEQIRQIRNQQMCQEALAVLGAGKYTLDEMNGKHRIAPLPPTFFKSSKKTSSYVKKYPFVQLVDLKNDSLEDLDYNSSDLLIFSYSDLCEWTILMNKILNLFTRASFMFIPSAYLEQSLHIIKHIFKRHDKRRQMITESGKLKNLEQNKKLISTPIQFIGTLRETLMTKLNIPIPLIMYSRDL